MRQTTGADTAATRQTTGIDKTHANDAACAGAAHTPRRLREPDRLKAVGHGRRKQIKGLPTGEYLAWRHLEPAARKAMAAPKHAAAPNRVHGIETGDRVRIAGKKQTAEGRAVVYAKTGRIRVQHAGRSVSTQQARAVRRTAGRNGYRRKREVGLN